MSPNVAAMNAVLAQNWWAIALRGLLGIAFGLIALLRPSVTMLSLVVIFAVYALVDGVFAIIAGVRAERRHERWGALILEGVAGIVVAVAAYVWPGLTVLVFVALIAIWALISGALMLAAAYRLHHAHGRGWLMLGGIVSVLYGGLLIVAPMIGALVLTWWLGVYALMFGVSLLIVAFRLRARHQHRVHGVAI